tara:strand:+ start:11236 stop:12261 length:1026 start_codon:yes stop_codon:yes gene_type:complete
MPELLATRCPLCKVAFYVTRAQLAAAQGKVRCGICLHIFNGNKHAIDYGDETVPETGSGQRQDPDNAAVIDDNYDIESQLERDSAADDIHQAAEAGVVAPEQSAGAGEHAGQDRELRPTPEQVMASQPDPGPMDANAQSPLSTDNAPPVLVAIEHPSQQRLGMLADTWRADQQSTLAAHKPVSSPIKRLAPLALIAAGIGALAIQLLHQASPALSTDSRYRPALALICEVLGCPITEQRDLNLIKSDRLMVQAHPDVHQALLVDLVLTNHAPFPQAFPDLRLQFTNLQGSTLAQRQFKPEEYLQGTMANIPAMAAEKAYRITLEIVDPGPAATSFSLTVTD